MNTPDPANDFASSFEPELSPDFAARVMREAGRIRTRRTILRRSGAALAVGAMVAGFYLTPALRAPSQQASTPTVYASNSTTDLEDLSNGNAAADDYSNTDVSSGSAANYMFPDAQSLQEFSDEYSDESSAAPDYPTFNSGSI
ncbi:MAG TPA: hypothetical protein VMA09_19160 [Candidatus Binataceae bacterium]|nr:hypothetical protein [Candidatus Binataceae bacterium]